MNRTEGYTHCPVETAFYDTLCQQHLSSAIQRAFGMERYSARGPMHNSLCHVCTHIGKYFVVYTVTHNKMKTNSLELFFHCSRMGKQLLLMSSYLMEDYKSRYKSVSWYIIIISSGIELLQCWTS